MTVVSLRDQKNLGSVEQPFLDLSSRKITALQVEGEFGSFIIPFAQVQRIGADTITVTGDYVAQADNPNGLRDGLVALEGIGALRLENGVGVFLGALSHVEIDPATGAITQLVAHKGGMLGMGGTTMSIDPRAIISVGPELLTVNIEGASAPAP